MSFALKTLDHVNVRTANLDAMIEWYGRILDMPTGPRPDFPFPGAWLYAGEQAIVHLIGVSDRPDAADADLRLEHFAISATGLKAMIGRLEAAGERMDLRKVPGFPIVQVNIWDPDGNHIHVDFDVSEAEGLDL